MRQAWTTSEQRWLAELAPEMTVAELCEKFGRSKGSIWGRLNKLGIVAKQQNKPWTLGEVKILKEMVNDFPYADIARELGRPVSSVIAYKNRNLDAAPRRQFWNPTRAQIDRIAELRKQKVKLSVIARTMWCSLENLKWGVRREKIERGGGYVR